MFWSAETSRGLVRSDNEDSWAVRVLKSPGVWLAMVADGIGGNECGELASALAIQHCAEYIASHLDMVPTDLLLREALQHGNRMVIRAADEGLGCRGMGTTLTCAVVAERTGELSVGHVGDSRAYLVRQGTIRQITEDHSIVGELVRNGTISEEDAMHHPARNVLTKALGTQEALSVSTYREKLAPGDIVLLCTDGLTSLVSSRDILSILARCPREEAASRLVEAANSRGGYDNITVIVMWPEVTVKGEGEER